MITPNLSPLVEQLCALSPEEALNVVETVSASMHYRTLDPKWDAIRKSAGGPATAGGDAYARVITAVTKLTGIAEEAILSSNREYPVVFARHLAMCLILEVAGISGAAVGRMFNRDHGTVLHARHALRSRYKSLPAERLVIDRARALLGLSAWSLPAPLQPALNTQPQPVSA